MTTFFKLRSQKSKDYSELSDVFEKIYWFNPEIIEHIELNFRRLIKKNDKEAFIIVNETKYVENGYFK